RHEAGQKSYWLAAFSSLMTSIKIVLFVASLFVVVVGVLAITLGLFKALYSFIRRLLPPAA
ncbi:MAG TPA: hypothetical protein VE360_03735, partial [Pyrinomonadaceae bacterium]|nr:hypothetical protein [Pyrinomonadaceae bacterium]